MDVEFIYLKLNMHDHLDIMITFKGWISTIHIFKNVSEQYLLLEKRDLHILTYKYNQIMLFYQNSFQYA